MECLYIFLSILYHKYNIRTKITENIALFFLFIYGVTDEREVSKNAKPAAAQQLLETLTTAGHNTFSDSHIYIAME